MKKIFIPTTKKDYTAKGYWIDPASGKMYKDFITYKYVEAISVKELKRLCKEYKQEAIFYEAINNVTGKKNTATCFYANGQKIKFNKIKSFCCYGISELKRQIRIFKSFGYLCYTIEKIAKAEFRIFTWKNDDNKIKKALKVKRIARRNELIKKLIEKLADGTPINYRIQNNINSGGRYNAYENKITISPYNIRHNRIYRGYSDIFDYYPKRGSKINPYVLHNYKNMLRFIILHEIGHAIFENKYRFCHRGYRHERYADAYALRYLRRYIYRNKEDKIK